MPPPAPAAAPHHASPSLTALTWDVDDDALANHMGIIEALHAVNHADGVDVPGLQVYPELRELANYMDLDSD